MPLRALCAARGGEEMPDVPKQVSGPVAVCATRFALQQGACLLNRQVEVYEVGSALVGSAAPHSAIHKAQELV